MSGKLTQLRRLYRYARPYWKLILVVLFLCSVYAATRALPIRLIRDFVDDGVLPMLNVGYLPASVTGEDAS